MAEVQNIAEHTDIADIEDIIMDIGESFNLKFQPNELIAVRTFGELCNAIIAKVELQNADDCTTQQAFYKLRNTIAKECGVKKSGITTASNLEAIFPREERKLMIKRVEAVLGFNLKIFRPKHIVINTLLMALLGSIIWVFFQHLYGFYAIVSSVLLIVLAEKTGKEFQVKTVGEVAEKMTMEHYMKSRRNPDTVNRAEMLKQIEKWFIIKLGIGYDYKTIAPEAIIVDLIHQRSKIRDENGNEIIPDVFTPNGDGKNDVFIIDQEGLNTYTIKIFNRWGDKVFESNIAANTWNGKDEKGVMQADGVYYYVVTGNYANGEMVKKEGYVELVNKNGIETK